MKSTRRLLAVGLAGLVVSVTGCAEFWRTHFPPRSPYGPVQPVPPVQPDRNPQPQPNPQPGPSPQPDPQPGPSPQPDPQPDPQPRPKPEPPVKYPVAQAVPGRPGFVFSPYNNKVIEVSGIASGTLVTDPHFPAAEKKYFRVP